MNKSSNMPLIIESKYNGPDNSGNGGYCCGRFAHYLDPNNEKAIEVTLRNPPPLETELNIQENGDSIDVYDSDTLIASAKISSLDISIPAPVFLKDAIAAEKNYVGFQKHPFPRCYVCGPERNEGDGLLIFPGKVPNQNLVAASWTPYKALANNNGIVYPEHIWAALDCPSFFGGIVDAPNTASVLGRLTLKIYENSITADQQYIICAWPISIEGRKLNAGAAIYSQRGECLAAAKALWISLKS